MTEPDYQALYLEERERRLQAENRSQPTTFKEFIHECHSLLSRPLEVRDASESTQGTITPPAGKCCPTRLSLWEDCPGLLQDIYDTVCKYLEPSEQEPRRLFPSIAALEELGRRFARRKLSSEQDLESYERFAVEDHVHDVIAELCKIPETRKRFQLGDGVIFDNHSNALHEANIDSSTDQPPNPRRCRPDPFCIRRIDGTTSSIVTTVEYKPPHKLSVQTLRDGLLQEGLQTMDFYESVANQDRIPIEEAAKMRYNAQQLVGAALVQEYHVMIQEGLAFSYLTNGLALVLLYVPEYNPGTLFYYLCEPNSDVHGEDNFQQPNTALARVLCLCLLSFTVPLRDQLWRNTARERLHTWTTTFDPMHAQIIEQTPGYTSSQAARSSISYQPSESSPIQVVHPRI
ncbi:hypothetical protein CNMCM6106_005933 [Aspergillus hiratsukae]|uniref:Uncharacterized protein n=1 Tax=Aspergillus hiratsukae TaxID=1194566 RepID=A0A8H6PRG6_9EURO|nr:hypothetical protein CNMCM6106_005933 [Aspergillus hiratsukae]